MCVVKADITQKEQSQPKEQAKVNDQETGSQPKENAKENDQSTDWLSQLAESFWGNEKKTVLSRTSSKDV